MLQGQRRIVSSLLIIFGLDGDVQICSCIWFFHGGDLSQEGFDHLSRNFRREGQPRKGLNVDFWVRLNSGIFKIDVPYVLGFYES